MLEHAFHPPDNSPSRPKTPGVQDVLSRVNAHFVLGLQGRFNLDNDPLDLGKLGNRFLKHFIKEDIAILFTFSPYEDPFLAKIHGQLPEFPNLFNDVADHFQKEYTQLLLETGLAGIPQKELDRLHTPLKAAANHIVGAYLNKSTKSPQDVLLECEPDAFGFRIAQKSLSPGSNPSSAASK